MKKSKSKMKLKKSATETETDTKKENKPKKDTLKKVHSLDLPDPDDGTSSQETLDNRKDSINSQENKSKSSQIIETDEADEGEESDSDLRSDIVRQYLSNKFKMMLNC